MATRWFKATGTAWNTANDWASTVGGVDNAGVPTAADDVILDNTSGACALNTTTGVCRSFDEGTGATKHTAGFSGSAALTIGTTTAPPGGIAFRASGTAWTHTGGVTLTSTAGGSGTITVTSAGIVFGGAFTNNMTGGATTQLADAFSCTGNFVKSGATHTWDSNGQSVTTAGNFNLSNGVVTCGASVWTSNGTNNLTQTITPTTLTAGTSEFRFNTGTGATTLNASGKSFYKLTITGGASKAGDLAISANFTVSNNLTFTANSATNRLLIDSNTLGTARTITCNGTVRIDQCVRFMDITAAGSASWDLSGGSVGGGTSSLTSDDGGNTGITFTTGTTLTANGTASFTWSTHAWTGGRVPLAQDDVSIPNAFIAGRTITADMPEWGKSITCTCTGNPAWNSSVTASVFGSITWAAGMTFTGVGSVLTLGGRSSFTITSAGVSMAQPVALAAPSGTYTLADAFTTTRSSTGVLAFTAGTFSDGGQSVTVSGANTSATIGGATLNLTGSWGFGTTNANTFWNVTSGTVNGSGSTITLTAATANTRTFAGGGQTYGTLTYTVAGSSGQLTVTGANTFTTVNEGSGRTIVWPASTTNIINGPNGLGGIAGTMTSSSAGVAATLNLTSLVVSIMRVVSLKDLTVTPNGHAYALDGSTNTSGNTGIMFATAPGWGVAA